jgi:hypothetical protein
MESESVTKIESLLFVNHSELVDCPFAKELVEVLEKEFSLDSSIAEVSTEVF